MAITIKDVAKLAGVAPSTVSRTCKDSPSISEKTKERVRLAMEELGYIPNFQATNLVCKNSKTIGIILPPTTEFTYQNTFFLEVIHGISNCCNKNKYSNTIIAGNSNEEVIETINLVIKSGKVDGFIVLFSKKDNKITKFLNENNYSFSMIGTPVENLKSNLYIDNDNIKAGYDATKYLINLGHKKIGFFCNNSSQNFVKERKIGYLKALKENGIEFEKNLYFEKSELETTDVNFLNFVLYPTAILAIDDILALSLEKFILSLNIKIPEDISIICFNNSLITELGDLTCVDINNYELGFSSCQQIIDYLNHSLHSKKIIVSHSIIERKSCKKIKE